MCSLWWRHSPGLIEHGGRELPVRSQAEVVLDQGQAGGGPARKIHEYDVVCSSSSQYVAWLGLGAEGFWCPYAALCKHSNNICSKRCSSGNPNPMIVLGQVVLQAGEPFLAGSWQQRDKKSHFRWYMDSQSVNLMQMGCYEQRGNIPPLVTHKQWPDQSLLEKSIWPRSFYCVEELHVKVWVDPAAATVQALRGRGYQEPAKATWFLIC